MPLVKNYIKAPAFNGPADQGILIKNQGNNAVINAKMSMPQKFNPSDGTSSFAMNRNAYSNNVILKKKLPEKNVSSNVIIPLQGNHVSSEVTNMRKIHAIGKSSQTLPIVSFQGNSKDTTVLNKSLTYCRSGGSAAPRKKGALANTFQSGGTSRITGRGNNTISVPNLYTREEVAQNPDLLIYNGRVFKNKTNSSNAFEHTLFSYNTIISNDVTHVVNNDDNSNISNNWLDNWLQIGVIYELAPKSIGNLDNCKQYNPSVFRANCNYTVNVPNILLNGCTVQNNATVTVIRSQLKYKTTMPDLIINPELASSINLIFDGRQIYKNGEKMKIGYDGLTTLTEFPLIIGTNGCSSIAVTTINIHLYNTNFYYMLNENCSKADIKIIADNNSTVKRKDT
tara:strand:- start:557 stop:1744 length:1188 start_codon:yes stop_codon:yes gene_type:complete